MRLVLHQSTLWIVQLQIIMGKDNTADHQNHHSESNNSGSLQPEATTDFRSTKRIQKSEI